MGCEALKKGNNDVVGSMLQIPKITTKYKCSTERGQ